MRLGIFGGAFNPVHNGHINLAKSYLNSLNLDKLLIISTANPPHRDAAGLADSKSRLDMLSLAFDGVDKIEVSDIEFKRKEKSYTYETIKEIRKTYADAEIFLIIGADQFLSFDKWYRYEDLLKEVVLCTAAREENMRDAIKAYAKVLLGDKCNYFLADFRPVIVSSSQIREKLKAYENISQLVPEKVYVYIKDKDLYIV